MTKAAGVFLSHPRLYRLAMSSAGMALRFYRTPSYNRLGHRQRRGCVDPRRSVPAVSRQTRTAMPPGNSLLAPRQWGWRSIASPETLRVEPFAQAAIHCNQSDQADAGRCLLPIQRDSRRGDQDLDGPRRLQPSRNLPIMSGGRLIKAAALTPWLAAALSGCAVRGAPSFVIAGSYFPGWMLCALIGIASAIAVRVGFIASGLSNVLPFQLFVCSAIGLCCGLLAWLLWFGH